MRAALSLFVVAIFIRAGSAQNTFTVKYFCDGHKLSVRAYGSSTAIARMYAAGKANSCGTDVTAGGTNVVFTKGTGLEASPVTFTIDTTAKYTTCGYAISTGTQRKITLNLLTDANRVQSTDGQAVITCESSTPYYKQEQTATVASITGEPGVSADIKVDATIEFMIVAQATSTVAEYKSASSLTSAALGDKVKLVAKLDTSATGKKAYLDSCTVNPASGNPPALQITDDKGCSSATNGVFSDNEKKNDAVSDATSNLYFSASPAFAVFSIPGSTGVKYTCNVRVCGSGDDRCNIPASCPVTSRRRRDASDGFKSGNVTTVLFITNPNLPNGPSGQEASFSHCLNHVSFISVVAILAVLLVVSLAVSVFFCSKLIRQNNDHQQRAAYPNPAFKA